jgi:hypothetical protein
MKLTEAFRIREALPEEPEMDRVIGPRKGGWMLLQPQADMRPMKAIDVMSSMKPAGEFVSKQDVEKSVVAPNANDALDMVPSQRVQSQLRTALAKLPRGKAVLVDLGEKDPTKSVRLVDRVD